MQNTWERQQQWCQKIVCLMIWYNKKFGKGYNIKIGYKRLILMKYTKTILIR